MPGGVNGAGGAGNINPYLDIAKQTTGYIQNAGVDMSAVNSIITYAQSPDAAIDGVVGGALDAMGASPVVKEVVSGAIDIVKIVLGGNYNMGADVQEAKQNGQEIADLTNTATQLSQATETASKDILSALTTDTEGVQTQINTDTQELIVTLENGTQETIKINDQNVQTAGLIKENNAKIAENQKKIEEEQTQMQELKAQIDALRNESGLGEAQFEDATIKGQGGEEGSSDISFKQMSNKGIENNPKLAELINKYNACAGVIAGFQAENAKLTTDNGTYQQNIRDNVATAQEKQVEQIEITEEKSANIDAAANEIVSMCNSAEGAINEVKNMLAGNFPKIDQVTLVKLATAMTKSAICGTNSGLLATAAATMGVGAIFSFGATAGEAAKLTAASVDQGAGAAAHIAANAAGKLAQQAATAAVNQVLSNVSNLVGVDLNGLYSQMTQFIGENSAMLAQAKDAASQTSLQTPEDLGVKDDGNGDTKKPETENA